MKICNRCNQEKNLDEFRKASSGRPDAYCYPCRLTINREAYAKHKEKRRAADRDRYLRNRDSLNAARQQNKDKLTEIYWKSAIKRRYNIDESQYETMLERQSGGCAICGTKVPWSRSKRFAIDHDHATGRVRGLLCHPCNRGIGAFSDDPARLSRAAEYVSAHPDQWPRAVEVFMTDQTTRAEEGAKELGIRDECSDRAVTVACRVEDALFDGMFSRAPDGTPCLTERGVQVIGQIFDEELDAAEARAASAEANVERLIDLVQSWEDAASALGDRVAVLESALKPFAIAADVREPVDKDRSDNIACFSGLCAPLVGHFRAARAALKESTHV